MPLEPTCYFKKDGRVSQGLSALAKDEHKEKEKSKSSAGTSSSRPIKLDMSKVVAVVNEDPLADIKGLGDQRKVIEELSKAGKLDELIKIAEKGESKDLRLVATLYLLEHKSSASVKEKIKEWSKNYSIAPPQIAYMFECYPKELLVALLNYFKALNQHIREFMTLYISHIAKTSLQTYFYKNAPSKEAMYNLINATAEIRIKKLKEDKFTKAKADEISWLLSTLNKDDRIKHVRFKFSDALKTKNIDVLNEMAKYKETGNKFFNEMIRPLLIICKERGERCDDYKILLDMMNRDDFLTISLFLQTPKQVEESLSNPVHRKGLQEDVLAVHGDNFSLNPGRKIDKGGYYTDYDSLTVYAPPF